MTTAGQRAGWKIDSQLNPLQVKLGRAFAARLLQEKISDLTKYKDDPVAFAKDMFGIRLWSKQVEVAIALTKHDRLAIKSGQKTGKSILAAVLAWWWAATRVGDGSVVMISSSFHQIQRILWKEIARLYSDHLKKWKGKPILPKPAEQASTGIKWPDGRVIYGLSTDKPERAQGLSGPNQLYIIDEASGIRQPLFDAFEGNTAGGGKIMMLGNPTQLSGKFFDAFHKERGEWKCFSISGYDAANCGQKIPGMATLGWLENRKRAWGERSASYMVRVLGEFPQEGDNSVVSMSLVEAAKARWHDAPTVYGVIDAGIDVARFGNDETTFAFRRGLRMEPIKARHGLDTQQVAGQFVVACNAIRQPQEIVVVRVDTIGVGGGVADALRAKDLPWLIVEDVVASERAIDDEKYFNRRSELGFCVAEWLESGGAIAEDDSLELELCAAQYEFDPKGRLKIESKDDIKARLGRSPDRADVVALCIAQRRPTQPVRRSFPNGFVP